MRRQTNCYTTGTLNYSTARGICGWEGGGGLRGRQSEWQGYLYGQLGFSIQKSVHKNIFLWSPLHPMSLGFWTCLAFRDSQA